MTHFTVLVKVPQSLLQEKFEETKDMDKAIYSGIAHMLAPYQENNMGDCPSEFLEFQDVTEQYKKKYETETLSRLVHKETGKIISPYNDGELNENCPLNPDWVVARDKLAEKEGVSVELAEMRMIFNSSYQGPKYDESDFEKVEIPVKEFYSDFDKYMTEYCGYKFNEDRQVYGFWENPNAKWDYYQVGGRWTGSIPVKDGCGLQGDPGLMTRENSPDEDGVFRTADIVSVKNIDFQRFDKIKEKQIQEFMESIEVYKKFVEEVQKPRKPFEEWHSDPRWRSVLFFDRTLSRYFFDWGVSERFEVLDNSKEDCNKVIYYDLTDFTEEIVREHSYSFEFSTWAVLDKDGWKEKGRVGYWATSDATAETTKSISEGYVDKFLRNEDPETIVAIVDCHI